MLQLKNVSFRYPNGNTVFQNVTFEGSGGDFLLVLGHNGAGKSTLLKLLNGILKPTSGQVIVNGLDTKECTTATLARHASITFQNPGDQIFASTVEEEVSFGPKNLGRQNSAELIEQALELFGLKNARLAHPYDLPFAQRKILTAASAAASGCPLLAFDEPSAGLSVPDRQLLATGITKLLQNNRLILVVSHDLDLFLPLASRVLVLHKGTLLFDGEPSTLIAKEKTLRISGLKLPFVMRLRRVLELPAFSSSFSIRTEL